MADVKYERTEDGAYYVIHRDVIVGRVYRLHSRAAWLASTAQQRTSREFGKRRSAAEWLVRQAEREPMHRGGAK